ncbi:hydrolase [Streptomyces sp. HUCO-GS316]|nr:ricin-type beta-trefoil lectin domain protein [Streptomyces sp. HUCO-GS316]MXM67319.1 hydrolase [Streptomyces sp. HUCO-GS316]
MDFVQRALGRNGAVNDAGLSNSPAAGRPFDATDEQLSAQLMKRTGTAPAVHPVGELLDRHWGAAFAYARLCTDGPRPAGILTTAAFTRLFGESLRHNGPTAAWRPQLLVTVRRIAAEWDGDHRRELLHPDLRSHTGERWAARLLPPPDRRLLSGAFQRLPQSARCLLWHSEVEAEPLAVPAVLLGLEVEDARVELGRARERLREECLQVHRELAPEQECGRYLRMLDVTYRRGGVAIDPDLRAHLDRCRHCRDTADQLNQFNGFLGIALAEAVFGWGARDYVEARAARPDADAVEAEQARPAFVGEAFPTVPAGPRPGSRRSAQKAARRAAARRRNVAAAALTVSGLIVLPLVLWSALGTESGTEQPGDGRPSDAPGSGAGPSTGDPSWAGTDDAKEGDVEGRLRNVASGLCVATVGDEAVKGAGTRLAKCSSASGQQWVYETDGLLRSVADPGLCLDSHLGYSVRLAPCTGPSQDSRYVRYDFTLQGALVPRWDQDLALAPAATDGAGALVLKNRAEDPAQRWTFDTSKADPQMAAVNWHATSPTPVATTAPQVSEDPTPKPTATPSTRKSSPTPTSSYPTDDACSPYGYFCSGNGRSDWPYGSGGRGGGHR